MVAKNDDGGDKRNLSIRLSQILRTNEYSETSLCVSWRMNSSRQASKVDILAIYRDGEIENGKEIYWRHIPIDTTIGRVFLELQSRENRRIVAVVRSVETAEIKAISRAIEISSHQCEPNNEITKLQPRIDLLAIEITELTVSNLPKRFGIIAPNPYVRLIAHLKEKDVSCETTNRRSCCNCAWRDQTFFIEMDVSEQIEFEVKDEIWSGNARINRLIGSVCIPLKSIQNSLTSNLNKTQFTFHLPLRLNQCSFSSTSLLEVTINVNVKLADDERCEIVRNLVEYDKLAVAQSMFLEKQDVVDPKSFGAMLEFLKIRYSNCSISLKQANIASIKV